MKQLNIKITIWNNKIKFKFKFKSGIRYFFRDPSKVD